MADIGDAPFGPADACRRCVGVRARRPLRPRLPLPVAAELPAQHLAKPFRWRAVGVKYGLGVIEGMLAHAIAEGAIPEQPLRPTAHVLLGALDEAALFVSRATNRDQARKEMDAVCDRLLSGIAGG